MIVYLLFTSILIFSSIDADPLITSFRLRRERAAVNTSMQIPKISALTEDAAVAASWRKCMVVAPVTIQLLGQLLLVSSAKDASLRAFSPNRKFTYVKNPESLRATLLQISHEGYHAFLSAHSSMNTIQLRMVQIPKHIKTAVKLLAGNYPHRVLNRLLPMILGNIEDTGKECVSVTNSTEQEFVQVMKLIDEVVQSTKATESEHQEAVSKNERQLEALRAQQESLAKEEKRRAELYKQATDAANRAEESYYQALREIPTGWEALLQDFVRGISKVANTVAKAAAQVFTSEMGNSMVAGGASMLMSGLGKRSIDGAADGDHEPSFGFSQTVDMASRFSNSLETFREVLGSSSGNVTAMDGLSVVFKTFREYISKLPNNAAKDKVLELMLRSERLVKKASTNGKQRQPDPEVEEEVTEELADISKQMRPYKTANQLGDPMRPVNVGSSSGSADGEEPHGDSSRNEILKARIAQDQLTIMRKRQDAYAAELSKILEQARETNSMIISIDLTTIDYRQIIKMLEEAFKLLARLREEWHHFVIFFNAMSQQVKGMVEHSLKRFLQMASAGNDLEHAFRLKLIGDLKEDTYSIHTQSYVLFVLARTYYDVSGKYLMARLSTLSSMLISRTPEERDRLRQDLQKDTDTIILEIKALIDERANAFDAELETRSKELNDMIDQLGGPSTDAQEVINDANQLLSADANWAN